MMTKIRKEKNIIEKFQYITCDTKNYTHSELAIKAIQAGCKWIQIRIKNKSKDFIKNEIEKVKSFIKINDLRNIKIIVNDYVELAKETKVDGVHLGKLDMHPYEARKILGKNAIIGGTANNFEDIINLVNAEIDYIGLGPFKFTTTKENLENILGLAGYREIIKKTVEINLKTPIIAIGGITYEDLNEIIKTGIYGVAVSSYVTYSNNFENTIQNFLQFFKN